MKFGKFLLAAALMVSSLSASAQETESTEFNHHWFLQLQGGAAYTLGEGKFFDLVSPAAQIAVGYQFTPVWALRLAVNGWESKDGFEDYSNTYKWNYIGAGLDVKFNLINAIGGWNPDRAFGLNLIAGVAANCRWNNTDNPVPVDGGGSYALDNYWNKTKFAPVGRLGFDIDYRLSKRVSLNLECMSNFLTDKYNSKAHKNDKFLSSWDWYFTALAGVKINLGGAKKAAPAPEPVPVVVEEPTPAPAPVVKEAPKPQPVVKKAPEMQTEIFYSIRETVIPDGEKGKITNLINFLKANPDTKVDVKSYADAGTGNPRINMKYSQGRAENVVKALVEGGIDANRITFKAFGDTVQPYSENDKNRVSICLAK